MYFRFLEQIKKKKKIKNNKKKEIFRFNLLSDDQKDHFFSLLKKIF